MRMYGLLFLLAVGCSVRPVTSITVVERADSLSSSPDWISLSKPVTEEDGKKVFLGYVEVDGRASKSAALNMSDEKAFSEPLRAMITQFLEQNQVGEDLMSSTGQRIIATTSSYRPPMGGLRIMRRYWEVIETRSDLGSRSVLRVYSQAHIAPGELEEAKQAYLAKLRGDSEVKKILADVSAKQRERALAEKE